MRFSKVTCRGFRTHVSSVDRCIRNPTDLIVAKLADTRGVDAAKLLEFNGSLGKIGAARGTRTPDPIITNDVLYQLS